MRKCFKIVANSIESFIQREAGFLEGFIFAYENWHIEKVKDTDTTFTTFYIWTEDEELMTYLLLTYDTKITFGEIIQIIEKHGERKEYD